MKKLVWLLLPTLAVGGVVWGILRKNEPPAVNFAKVKRQTLISTLPTNGRVEPLEWQSARAESAGLVSRVMVLEGGAATKGAVLAVITDPTLQADIEAAEAKAAESRAALSALEAGGRPVDLSDIESNLDRAHLDLQQATSEYNSLRRLAEKQAATTADVQTARDKVRQTELTIAGLEKRRTSLVAKPDVTAARARVQDAEVAVKLAHDRAAQGTVRAPIAGTVYSLTAKAGSYLNVGDPVANIGRFDRLHVRVYVDEPELGRVAEGQPVTITWQALAGRKWQGVVERKPTSIQALGSRQVGEVVCSIDNPGRELIPGTNVDAEIRTAVVETAQVIPREAMRHDANGDYVLRLNNGTVERRTVRPGASSVSQIQILEGLSDNDSVALPSDIPLKPGDRVTAIM